MGAPSDDEIRVVLALCLCTCLLACAVLIAWGVTATGHESVCEAPLLGHTAVRRRRRARGVTVPVESVCTDPPALLRRLWAAFEFEGDCDRHKRY